MKIYKMANNLPTQYFNIFLSADKVGEISAVNIRQAIKLLSLNPENYISNYTYLREKGSMMGWKFKIVLNKDKMARIEKDKEQKEKNIQDMWWNRD
jgi:hypothetical protein